MSWEKRMELSINLLSETATLLSSEDSFIIADSLEMIKNYLNSEDFNNSSEEEKNKMSVAFLINSLDLCGKFWYEEKDKLFPQLRQTISFEEAKDKLMEEYLNDIKNGNDDIASLNINDWIIANGIILQDDNIQQISSSANE